MRINHVLLTLAIFFCASVFGQEETAQKDHKLKIMDESEIEAITDVDEEVEVLTEE
jgi:hypothetical protein